MAASQGKVTLMAEMILHNRFESFDDVLKGYGGEDFRIDLGCGYVKPAGFIGLDNLAGARNQKPCLENAPDILMDLNLFPLPFGDSTCVEVRASHFLEHSNYMHILDEVHRVLKPGGIFLLAVPYANSAEGMYPGHTLFFTEKWFYQNLIFQEKFQIVHEEFFPSDDYNALPRLVRIVLPFEVCRKFLFNVCWQMMLTCVVRK